MAKWWVYSLVQRLEAKTIFLYARVHKYPNLEEAVVALVGFPLVVLHGVDDQLDVEEAAVAAHGADGRLGVVVDGADDRLASQISSS